MAMNASFFRIAAIATLAFATAGSAVLADPTPVPSPNPLPTLPAKTDPYVRTGVDLLIQVIGSERQRVANGSSGTVTYFKRFDMQVQTGGNRYRNVHLHQGTVINPRGVSISAGQTVDVSGRSQSDGSLEADVITIHV